jgi:WD40 repeat protein
MFQHFYWLLLAEYISIFITFISLVIALISDNKNFLLLFLCFSVFLNLINRLLAEQRNRKRIGSSIAQLRELSTKISSIEQKVAAKEVIVPTPSLQISDSRQIAAFQEYLGSLEQSIDRIVQYLNSSCLLERVENLEKNTSQSTEKFIYEDRKTNSGAIYLPPETVINKVANRTPQTWKCVNILSAHSQSVTGLAISPDGKFLASVSWDRTLRIWSVADGTSIDSASGNDRGLLAVSFAREPASNLYYLVTGGFDQTIKLWSMEFDREKKIILIDTLKGHTGSIHALAIAKEQKIIASGSYDRTIKQWDLETGELLHSCYNELGPIYAIAVDPERETIASGGGDGSVTLWHLGSNEKIGSLRGNLSSVESVAIASDGRTVAAGCVDGNIKIWQLEFLSLSREVLPSLNIPAHAGQVMSLAFSPDGETLFSSGADGRVKIWHWQSSQQLAVLQISDRQEGRADRVLSLALSPDGELLAAGSVDGTIQIWRRERTSKK